MDAVEDPAPVSLLPPSVKGEVLRELLVWQVLGGGGAVVCKPGSESSGLVRVQHSLQLVCLLKVHRFLVPEMKG